MRPIILQGHERSLTQIKYNKEGDLLFSVSKDKLANVWFSHNGERLGTYDGHNGTVWCIDVDYASKYVLTGSADQSARLWECRTGKQLVKFATPTSVRTCGFSYSGKTIFYTTDNVMGHPCRIFFHDLKDELAQSTEPKKIIDLPAGNKITAAVFGPLDKTLITGHDDGTINVWDVETGKIIKSSQEHEKYINSIQLNGDQTSFVSASKDSTAKLFDTETLEVLKTYKTPTNVNSAAISPLRPHVVLGGGQEAREVTTTSTRVGKFEVRFFHLIFEEEIGRVKGHFGPINTVAFHPSGKSFASGGEDGFIRVHAFDPDYYEFEFDY
ncbi:Trip1-PA [Capsaspora owczarzaki ATCC 30864]|uniref:Trip1-PA n=1 Tax=Capsaspora owczarzaki (strain ATCC 30864) TaxID=595528 RepID=UPI00035209C0|nr:Trip1-PA [Capsaspora owczarzaki ATCC 30864]|eukprot:XP_004364074.2 Trip1-PA [Capsaspora owczarzaki ATCC 30864]